MKPSLLFCLLTLLLLAALLAACAGNDSHTSSASEDRTAEFPSSPAIGTTLLTPVQTTVPATSVSTADSSAADSSGSIPESDEPITATPVTTTNAPSSALPQTTAIPVTTAQPTTATATTTAIPVEPPAPEAHWVVTCNEYIVLRKTASTASETIAKLTPGESVELIYFTGKSAKVKYKELIGYVNASYLTRPEGMGTDADLTVVNPVQNYSYEQMQSDLAALAEQFPDLLTLSSIGKSEEGRDLTLAILGNPEAEHSVFMQASIHAREHVVSLLAMSEIDYILHHTDTVLDNGMTIAELLREVSINIVPMSNPDGVTISQTATLPAPFADRYNRNNAIQWKANVNGIDLNANFDADWDRYQSSFQSTAPAYAGFKGTSPECAAESKALADYLRANAFDLTLSYHTSGSLIYWSYDYENHPEVNKRCRDIAELLSDKTGFTLGAQASTSTAGLKDWAIQSLGIPSLTIEFAVSSAPAPLREFEQTWARGKYTLLTSALWAREQE